MRRVLLPLMWVLEHRLVRQSSRHGWALNHPRTTMPTTTSNATCGAVLAYLTRDRKSEEVDKTKHTKSYTEDLVVWTCRDGVFGLFWLCPKSAHHNGIFIRIHSLCPHVFLSKANHQSVARLGTAILNRFAYRDLSFCAKATPHWIFYKQFTRTTANTQWEQCHVQMRV